MENNNFRSGVSIEEAAESIYILKDAALETNYDLTVLEVGGVRPLTYATHILSRHTYDSGNVLDFYPPSEEVAAFNSENWQVCNLDDEKWPYEDKAFDVCWCVDILDTVENPLHVLHEISRVSRIGYVRVVDRNYESLINVESSDYAGYKDHNWLIEWVKNKLVFMLKPVETKDFQPTPTGDRYIGIMWRGSINGKYLEPSNVKEELEDYVRRTAEHSN